MSPQYRSDYRASVTRALGPLLAPLARWNKSAISTVTNIPELLPARAGTDPAILETRHP